MGGSDLSSACREDDVASLPALPGTARVVRLDNGLTLCLLENRQAPVVATALWYRAGSRNEPSGCGGLAHFLEHMMFKGSPAYGAGEIDRRTLSLGGHNNAFTSHDATVYHFQFAAPVWEEALHVEADRMAALTLAPPEVDSERQVILEEISMYENDPWDALEQAVFARLYGEHPYARSVLGSREELLAMDGGDLERFHERHYGPDNAVLVVAGDLAADTEERVLRHLGQLPPRGVGAAAAEALVAPTGLERLERRHGDLARLMLALPACPSRGEDHAVLRLLVTLLCVGRTSRLHRRLVEELRLCLWISGDVSDTLDEGTISIAAEVIPGVEPQLVEEALLAELSRLREEDPASETELERAKRILVADWVFAHDRILQQAMEAGSSLALFEQGHGRRVLASALACDAVRVRAAARRYLDPAAGSVVGWSLPECGA